ncbi:hypothetical protein [Pyxidicoccus trucidator]|uniref:hypothetical protein n=1 Tax=Pyxidicoccus trucidator TaxID=2709662 RepID=UPI0013D9EB04|nr:hypothetical protein [Pyxidicoccus trucidator]
MNMQNKATVSALLAVAMLAAGCGGGDIAVNEQSNLATRTDAARAYSYDVYYYDGPDLVMQAGFKMVGCSGPIQMYGVETEYSVTENVAQCSYGGYECPELGVPCF